MHTYSVQNRRNKHPISYSSDKIYQTRLCSTSKMMTNYVPTSIDRTAGKSLVKRGLLNLQRDTSSQSLSEELPNVVQRVIQTQPII